MNGCTTGQILRESLQQTDRLRVDRENGILRDVKLLGFESRNCGRAIGLERGEFGDAIDRPYCYAKESAVRMAPLYEGKPVNVDHWNKETDRPVGSVFGELRGVYVQDDGIYARELHYTKHHPQAEHIAELAERFPTKVGLSHIAAGEPRLIEGRVVIETWEPECVDFVSTPATTKGLYESTRKGRRKMKKFKVREIVAKHGTDALKAVLAEMDSDADFTDVGDTELSMPAETSPEDQAKAAVMALITAKLETIGASELAKILKVLSMEDKLSALLGMSDAPAETATESEDDPPAEEDKLEEDDEDKDAMESLRQENLVLKARAALAEAGCKITDGRIAALVAVDTSLHAELIESWAAVVPSNGKGRPLHSPPAVSTGDNDAAFQKLMDKYAGAK